MQFYETSAKDFSIANKCLKSIVHITYEFIKPKEEEVIL